MHWRQPGDRRTNAARAPHRLRFRRQGLLAMRAKRTAGREFHQAIGENRTGDGDYPGSESIVRSRPPPLRLPLDTKEAWPEGNRWRLAPRFACAHLARQKVLRRQPDSSFACSHYCIAGFCHVGKLLQASLRSACCRPYPIIICADLHSRPHTIKNPTSERLVGFSRKVEITLRRLPFRGLAAFP